MMLWDLSSTALGNEFNFGKLSDGMSRIWLCAHIHLYSCKNRSLWECTHIVSSLASVLQNPH